MPLLPTEVVLNTEAALHMEQVLPADILLGIFNQFNTSPSVIANERGEQQLAEHILKALSPEESAPKQKHVRACIVYTHDLKSSGTLFMGIKAQPVVGDEVLTWKSLILFHKVISQGHSSVFRVIY